MDWSTFRYVISGGFALFAAVLLLLPGWRLATGRLRLRHVWGFLLAGLGFAALAAGTFRLPEPRAQALIIVGVVATVIGNLAQQRIARAHRMEE